MTTIHIPLTHLSDEMSLEELRTRFEEAEARDASLRAAYDQVRAERKAAERALRVRERRIANERLRLRRHLAHGVTCAGERGIRYWACACGASGSIGTARRAVVASNVPRAAAPERGRVPA